MSNRLSYRSDQMADFDWLSSEGNATLTIVRREAERVAGRFNMPDMADDLTQEGFLYLAVRPQLEGKHEGNISLRLRRYYTDIIMRERDDREHDRMEE